MKNPRKQMRLGMGIGLILAGAVFIATVNNSIGLALLAIGVVWVVLSFTLPK